MLVVGLIACLAIAMTNIGSAESVRRKGCTFKSDCNPGETCHLFHCYECLNDRDCPGGVCANKKCQECSVNSDCPKPGVCYNAMCYAECVVTTDCLNPSRPACENLSNTCTECVVNTDCPDPLRPACISYTCEECAEDWDCIDPAKPVCNVSQNKCVVECTTSLDCTDSIRNICSTSNKCEECVEDSDCTNGVCTDHRCYDCSDDGDCPNNFLQCPTCMKCDEHECYECLSDGDCDSNICDKSTRKCLAEGECITNKDCICKNIDKPICDVDCCVECSKDKHCGKDPSRRRCFLNVCIGAEECKKDGDCKAMDRSKPYCIDSFCEECKTNEECSDSAKPNCALNTCIANVACVNDEECRSNNQQLPFCVNDVCRECGDSANCLQEKLFSQVCFNYVCQDDPDKCLAGINTNPITFLTLISGQVILQGKLTYEHTIESTTALIKTLEKSTQANNEVSTSLSASASISFSSALSPVSGEASVSASYDEKSWLINSRASSSEYSESIKDQTKATYDVPDGSVFIFAAEMQMFVFKTQEGRTERLVFFTGNTFNGPHNKADFDKVILDDTFNSLGKEYELQTYSRKQLQDCFTKVLTPTQIFPYNLKYFYRLMNPSSKYLKAINPESIFCNEGVSPNNPMFEWRFVYTDNGESFIYLHSEGNPRLTVDASSLLTITKGIMDDAQIWKIKNLGNDQVEITNKMHPTYTLCSISVWKLEYQQFPYPSPVCYKLKDKHGYFLNGVSATVLCSQTTGKSWLFDYTDDGRAYIVDYALSTSNRLSDATDDSPPPDNGLKIVADTSPRNDDQIWIIDYLGNDEIRITNKKTGNRLGSMCPVANDAWTVVYRTCV